MCAYLCGCVCMYVCGGWGEGQLSAADVTELE
jgi:hypothetical protein